MKSVDLTAEETKVLCKIADEICNNLNNQKVSLFKARPSVYVSPVKDKFHAYPGNDKFHVLLVDRGRPKTRVITSRPKAGLLGFFIDRFMIDDFLKDNESAISFFASDKSNDFLEETKERNAYSSNLRRARELMFDNHHYAAVVILVSAFEVASRDMFFRNNQYWFITLGSPDEELYKRFGVRLEGDEKEWGSKKFRTHIHLGDRVFGFDDANERLLRQWESVLLHDKILHICSQLGILDEYMRKLYGNSFHEIGDYEILKFVLMNSQNRPLNFQMLEGRGGVKWCFKQFLDIDIVNLQKEVSILKDCFQLRHRIIHGEVEEKTITKKVVLDLEESVRKVISYIRNETSTWSWVLD